jgi:hypothetical protein
MRRAVPADPSIGPLQCVYDDGRAATKEWAPMSAFRIGILWFAVIAVVTGGVALFRHELNGWFFGWLVIDAASAFMLAASIRIGGS